jgi:glycosyltransferase involved in cell wall biosynthesis
MRVGLIVPGFGSDSADWCIPVLIDVVRELSRCVDLRIFALRYPYRRDEYRLHGAQIHALGGGTARGVRRGPLLTAACAAIIAEHRRGRFDILHGLWVDEPGFVAVTVGRLLRIPNVVSVMGGELVRFPEVGYGGRLTRSGRILSSLALHTAAQVTAGSAHAVRLARASLQPKHCAKVSRLAWGIDPQLETGWAKKAAPVHDLAGGFRVLQVGSLVPVKDHATLVRAIAQLRATEAEVHLHIVGDGPLRSALAEQVAALGLTGSATFHGHVLRHELAPYYQAADVLAISSRHEAQSVVALEAGLCRLPIVGTEVGLVADFAPHAAIAVPVGDDAALATALAQLREPAARRALGTTARHLVRSGYLATHTAKQLVTLYEQMNV